MHQSRSVRSRSASSASNPAALTTRSSGEELLKTSRAGRSDERSAVLLPIDENVAASLVAKVASLQQTQIFIGFVLAAFPVLFQSGRNLSSDQLD